jgi:CCR4-NOT complex subunit CAF16
MLGLLKPFQVLLLDEITVDLDVHVRKSLLHFLKRETEQRGATILYATHIFDGLNEWATHLCRMSNGR